MVCGNVWNWYSINTTSWSMSSSEGLMKIVVHEGCCKYSFKRFNNRSLWLTSWEHSLIAWKHFFFSTTSCMYIISTIFNQKLTVGWKSLVRWNWLILLVRYYHRPHSQVLSRSINSKVLTPWKTQKFKLRQCGITIGTERWKWAAAPTLTNVDAGKCEHCCRLT